VSTKTVSANKAKKNINAHRKLVSNATQEHELGFARTGLLLFINLFLFFFTNSMKSHS